MTATLKIADQGQYAQAGPLYKRSLAIWEKEAAILEQRAAGIRAIKQ